jgi:hypothetical protein
MCNFELGYLKKRYRTCRICSFHIIEKLILVYDAHTKRQATQHGCLPSLLRDGDKWFVRTVRKKYFVLGRLKQPRQNKKSLVPARQAQPRKDHFHLYSLSPHSPQFSSQQGLLLSVVSLVITLAPPRHTQCQRMTVWVTFWNDIPLLVLIPPSSVLFTWRKLVNCEYLQASNSCENMCPLSPPASPELTSGFPALGG